jgi:predicted O-methyltransferase YrrM
VPNSTADEKEQRPDGVGGPKAVVRHRNPAMRSARQGAEVMTLDQMLSNPPLLHDDAAGGLTSWALSADVLRFLDRVVQPGWKSLETGAGLSTLVFAARGSAHTCITASQAEVQRIRDYCSRHLIDLSRMTFHTALSEDVLPRLEPEPLDIVLIDGRHGFPAPFIDWYYTSRRLALGGTLVVDDTQLWTCGLLRNFLVAEPEWELVSVLGKTTVFKKLAHGAESKEWTEQRYSLPDAYASAVIPGQLKGDTDAEATA